MLSRERQDALVGGDLEVVVVDVHFGPVVEAGHDVPLVLEVVSEVVLALGVDQGVHEVGRPVELGVSQHEGVDLGLSGTRPGGVSPIVTL